MEEKKQRIVIIRSQNLVRVNYLCSKVLQDSSKVDRGTRSDALEVTSEPTNGELKASLHSLGHRLLLGHGGLSSAALGALGGSPRFHGF
mgnify:CR=1 FL=1